MSVNLLRKLRLKGGEASISDLEKYLAIDMAKNLDDLKESVSNFDRYKSGNIQTSESCGSYSTSSATFVDITNLQVRITTYGRPVCVMMVPAGSTTASSYIDTLYASSFTSSQVAFLRDSNIISIHSYGATISGATLVSVSYGSFPSFVDPVGPGTYIYKVQGLASFGGTLSVEKIKLIAYEI